MGCEIAWYVEGVNTGKAKAWTSEREKEQTKQKREEIVMWKE